MPLYHFNTYNGVTRLDADGTDLPDTCSARLEAIRLAGTILTEEAEGVTPGGDWRVEVTDPAGLILCEVRLLVTEARPATGEALHLA